MPNPAKNLEYINCYSSSTPRPVKSPTFNIICNTAIYAGHTKFYSKFDQTPDLWQQLELASEFESHLRDTEAWGRK